MTREQKNEYEAWKYLCDRLKGKGININKEDDLHNAIRSWGLCFVELLKNKKK